MEDVEMALRINNTGTSVWTPATITVSARRYTQYGTGTVAGSVIRHTLSYLCRRRWYDAAPDMRQLYEKYYEEKNLPLKEDVDK